MFQQATLNLGSNPQEAGTDKRAGPSRPARGYRKNLSARL